MTVHLNNVTPSLPHSVVEHSRTRGFSASATGNYSGIQRSHYIGMERQTGSILAEDPSDFGDSGKIKKVEPDDFAGVTMIES
ncbi:hypothetical protein PISMIDRAFT_688895, partial [Pisolithus microcarpus 441]